MAELPDPPAPRDADDANRRWRLWASVGAVAFVGLAVVIGFFVISSRGEDGVAGALGIHQHDEAETSPAVASSPPPTSVAWTRATLTLLEEAVAEEGAPLALACSGCHGENGIGIDPSFPNLAGQHRTAIYKQLRDYADGHRLSPIMTSMVQGLDDGQMAGVAAFFASLPAAPRSRPAETPADIVELATNGDPTRGIPPCDSCHAARGALQGVPALDGQSSVYLQQQMVAFAGNQRGNDIYGLMRSVAAMLTDAEIEQLAHYYGH